jgi:histidinol phosphatase-like PHP family hydrolase/predicted nuclease with RNAse H fold/dephospho-CoA kinase
MFDFEIARYLYRVSFLYNIIHDSIYKSRAYFKAAMAVDGYSNYIETLYLEGKLRSLPFVGASIVNKIGEIIEKKKLSLINDLLGNIPDTIFDLYEYANINDRLLKKIISLNVFSFESISNMLTSNEQCLSFPERKALSLANKNYETRYFQYAHAYELAMEIILSLQNSNLVDDVSLSDDLYLKKESVKTGDVICTLKTDYNLLIKYLQNLSAFRFISSTENNVLLERYGINFNIFILTKKDFELKIKTLEEQRKENTFSCETDLSFYGDLHLHTNWSDGLHSIEQMRDMALGLGYKYIAITDHSQSLKPSGMSELDTLMQIKKIREINRNSTIPILSGIEVDILKDGSLDIPDSILKEFDIVIASVHFYFNQPPFDLDDRMEKALSNKYVNILAHPTGRLLGRPGKPTVIRKEMDLDFDKLLQLCKNYNVALEINCFPERFDLSLKNAIKAVSNGIKISIGTDSHSMYHMNCAKYAVAELEYAGIPKEAVLNCQPIDKVREIMKKKRTTDQVDTESVLEEKFKNFNHYFSDNNDIVNGSLKVVGIDLTSSEKKASGFAVLSGTTAETLTALTDDEMVKRISEIKPSVISIDSPLSLPEGRCCFDKNCECSKYGIMRQCELLLRHFGIGVYPCLIDSMVNLTVRGMNLTKRLRGFGFNVIESYPGVAQDLLHIPRKQKGLEFLLNGMKNFGIEGIRENITHDEADAITSALVGYFYLDNKYVGMGNEKEGYLIVPKLETYLHGKGLVIGLIGQIAAGKTTVAEYLRFKYGFMSMRFSKLIEEKYHVSGRDNLQRVGLEIANDFAKQKELSDFMLNKIKEKENYVIDGIRQVVDYENLSSSLGKRFKLIYIESPYNAREKRYRSLEPNVSAKKFREIDTRPVEMSIFKIIGFNNFILNNNNGYKELIRQMDTILLKLNI